MGLRLYQAPVESDVPPKPAADKSSAQARSSIRRSRLTRTSEIREHRRRILTATAAYHSREQSRRTSQSPTAEEPAAASTSDSNGAPASELSRDALRRMANRMGILDDRFDRFAAVFGERWAQLHPDSGASNRSAGQVSDPWLISRVPPPIEPYTMSSIRSTQAPNLGSRSSTRSPPGAFRPRRSNLSRSVLDDSLSHWADPSESWDDVDHDSYLYLHSHEREGELDSPREHEADRSLQSLLTLQAAREESARREALEHRHTGLRFDGLGDRNRSLSPEGDNVWDTLLTTLAPDPQPPSVGSSFASASASASAAASQSTAAGSSRTTLTSQDPAEYELPCESGCEGSDTEGDEEDEADQVTLTRFPSSLRANRRSYADVTRASSSSEETLTLLGGIGGMQRIMRNLARREDIPDEWWAEAGLSRTLSREASSN
ncbi:hypothetical protein QBC46DRAFT_336209 [Diplogelasinospora grovesii]|uniref:Uncharacterized protein n=1 Tax=Diplogelasinospora grovesii TaxID=303347 RepID=A0AAN6NLV7_9PEZI|nr:hypothetical protein QBC46DRAFT_336209 [Diplogelasinospora grovesii]